MLARRHRLRRSEDIQKVIRYGRKIHTPVATVSILKQENLHIPSRAAVIVGKKVSSSAVRRHRYKRWLREVASSMLLDMPQGYDIIWLAKPAMATISSSGKLQEVLRGAIREIRSIQ